MNQHPLKSTVQPDGTLVLHMLQRSDSGLYYCMDEDTTSAVWLLEVIQDKNVKEVTRFHDPKPETGNKI